MKNYHMKMRVVIESFFRSHSSGNCILDHSVLSSDECLPGPCAADGSRKVSSHFPPLLSKVQHQKNQSEA